jgi:hypothetical protein
LPATLADTNPPPVTKSAFKIHHSPCSPLSPAFTTIKPMSAINNQHHHPLPQSSWQHPNNHHTPSRGSLFTTITNQLPATITPPPHHGFSQFNHSLKAQTRAYHHFTHHEPVLVTPYRTSSSSLHG